MDSLDPHLDGCCELGGHVVEPVLAVGGVAEVEAHDGVLLVALDELEVHLGDAGRRHCTGASGTQVALQIRAPPGCICSGGSG